MILVCVEQACDWRVLGCRTGQQLQWAGGGAGARGYQQPLLPRHHHRLAGRRGRDGRARLQCGRAAAGPAGQGAPLQGAKFNLEAAQFCFALSFDISNKTVGVNVFPAETETYPWRPCYPKQTLQVARGTRLVGSSPSCRACWRSASRPPAACWC